MDHNAELIVKLAWHYLGTPYKWGGDDPMEGFDCSGFVIELYQSVGWLPVRGDWTAHQLYERAKGRGKLESAPVVGGLAFYGSPGRVTHVTVVVDVRGIAYCIGANAGGSKTLTVDVASQQNAFVKLRPVGYRADLVSYSRGV